MKICQSRWITCALLFMLESSSFLASVSAMTAKQDRSSRTRRSAGMADPTVALEGQCLVVCDADVVDGKPEIRPRSSDGSEKSEPLSSVLDKMQSSACGGLVSVGRRNRRVAFSVKRSTELATTDSTSNGRATVTFDHVMVNVGNAFETETSTFVAPVNGVYSFSFQVYRLYNKNSLTIDLHVNGISILRGFADDDSANHNSAHNTGLVHLSARDRVSVQMSNGNLESGWKYSTFSGYLVFEDDDL